jgi:hypothetical protein
MELCSHGHIELQGFCLLRRDPRIRLEQGFHIVGTACRWYGLQVVDQVVDTERAQFQCRVVAGGTLREYFGLNRGKHAVLEAAILATRVHLLPPDEIAEQFAKLRPWVEKTGALVEHQAFEMLSQYVQENAGSKSGGSPALRQPGG